MFAINDVTMNNSFFRAQCRMAVFVVALGSVFPVLAQSHKQLVTTVGTAVMDTLAGINLDVSESSPLARHGEVDVQVISSGGQGIPVTHRIRYTPDPGFVGVDTFTVVLDYLGSYPYLVYKAYQVLVSHSLVSARQDYGNTAVGTPILLNVLQNDQSSANGPLALRSVPAVNYGTAQIQGNQVLFTPQPGFKGLAHFNYVVCDVLQTCKTGVASVGVTSGVPVNDTLRAATAKNTRLDMPLERSGYTLLTPPQNGTVSLQNGRAFQYRPNANFTGTDRFVLNLANGNQNAQKTVLLHVLNTAPVNSMAMDDRVSTPRGQAVTLNVRANDVGGLSVRSWVTPPGFPGTLSGAQSNGKVTFTPSPNFTGVATFYYKLGNLYSADIETGTVYVTVGNMSPAAPRFELTTTLNTPLVLNYKLPFTGFNFAILTPPTKGTCQYFPGNSTQQINGQTITGYNLLLYTPQAGHNGLDSFEVRYCTPANGDCQNIKIAVNTHSPAVAPPYCVGDCVWAGDLNRDGIVNNKDLLPLGYAIGTEGAARPNASLQWYGQGANNWNAPFLSNAADLKHADADGNGVINSADTAAIAQFYGRTNALLPSTVPTSKGLPFVMTLLTPNPRIGERVEIEISLGTEAFPVTNLSGFSFDLSLSPKLRDSALRIQYYPNTWLHQNSPSLWYAKSPRSGRLESAFTRTSGVPTHGFGRIAKVDFVVVDIIDGAKPNGNFELRLDNAAFLSGQGQWSEGAGITLSFPLSAGQPIGARSTSVENLRVFPIPAAERLRIESPQTLQSVLLRDLTGRVVCQAAPLSQIADLDVSHLPSGFYLLSALTEAGWAIKKVEVGR